MIIRRSLLWTGVVAVFMVALWCLVGVYGTRSISLNETQIQERIDAQLGKELPVKGFAHLLVKRATLKNVSIKIRGGMVTALTGVEGTMLGGKKFSLVVSAIGVPSFSSGAFFFKPAEIEIQKFAYDGSTPTELVTQLAERYMSDEKARRLIQDGAPKAEEWMTLFAQGAVTQALERKPVYNLEDNVTGLLLKASLKSVSVEGNRLVVTFSWWQLTISVLFGICLVAAAIAMMYVLVQHPLLGTALIVLS